MSSRANEMAPVNVDGSGPKASNRDSNGTTRHGGNGASSSSEGATGPDASAGTSSDSESSDDADSGPPDTAMYQPLDCVVTTGDSADDGSDEGSDREDSLAAVTTTDAIEAAVARVAARSMDDDLITTRGQRTFGVFTPPSAPVEAALAQSDDFHLSQDNIATIQSLMSGMSLPADGFPEWTTAAVETAQRSARATKDAHASPPAR